MKNKHNRRICQFEKEEYSEYVCPECESRPVDMCLDCHLEKVHGKIKDQNIHIIGGPLPNKTDGLDNDPDASAPSWKAGN